VIIVDGSAMKEDIALLNIISDCRTMVDNGLIGLYSMLRD
jgi:hypothetical protein